MFMRMKTKRNITNPSKAKPSSLMTKNRWMREKKIPKKAMRTKKLPNPTSTASAKAKFNFLEGHNGPLFFLNLGKRRGSVYPIRLLCSPL